MVFGGRSSEHEVSLASARSVMEALDSSRYEITPIGIDPEGLWLLDGDPLSSLEEALAKPAPTTRVTPMSMGEAIASINGLDIILPILHGPYGEDGTIQGLMEMADLPYVGSGVLGSSIAMDKGVMKALFLEAGIPTAPYRQITTTAWRTNQKSLCKELLAELVLPLFVKPANLGSSIGITKVHTPEEFVPAVDLASQHDSRIIIEESIEPAREIECAVLGNDNPEVSVCGEVFAAGEFYDYESKYKTSSSRTEAPADLPQSVASSIQSMAIRVFNVLHCSGLARIDFLFSTMDQTIFVLEANTMPGFTQISMYPKLWEASGRSYPALLDCLIELGLERYRVRAALGKTS